MLPRQLNNIPENRKAVAPYNFVELPNKIVEVKEEDLPQQNIYYSESENKHTGRIECTLTTKSPLYIRCGLTKEEFECDKESKDLPDFFYNQPEFKHLKPVIPGSSLRGMLRSLVEIISFSKLELVSNNQRLFFRAVAENPKHDSLGKTYKKYVTPNKVQAGYLDKDKEGWYIQPTKKSNGNSFAWVRETDLNLEELKKFDDDKYHLQYIDISFQQVEIDNKDKAKRLFAQNLDLPETHEKKGVLVTSGNMKQGEKPSPRRNHCVIFQRDLNSQKLRINNKAIEHYCNALTDFQKQTPFDSNYGILEENRPVFYSVPENYNNNIVFFGQSPNFRIPYSPEENGNATTIVDFIPPKLKKSSAIDIADAIFGFVRHKDDKNTSTDTDDKTLKSLAGRIFIENAICNKTINDDIWLTGNFEKTLTPKILSNPKPTTFQHYLVQTNAEKNQLKHYASEPPKEHEVGKTTIRGHKLYWHKPNVKKEDIEETDTTKIQKASSQYTKIKPIKAGVSFQFNIHFENLNNIELGAILWILKIVTKPEYCLSLGMGKPLGMGAVKIEHELLLNNRQNRYSKLFSNNQWLTGEENQDDTISKYDACIDAFKKCIVDNIHEDDYLKGYNATELEDIPRIQMLLLMLRCENLPPANDTRYMTIEPSNEYKERPVLPTPFQVMGEEDKRRFALNTAKTNVVEKPKVKPTPKPQIKKTLKAFQLGEILDATVFNIKGVEVTYQLPDEKKTTKEHKKAQFLKQGQNVKVKITALKDDGSIKNIKYYE